MELAEIPSNRPSGWRTIFGDSYLCCYRRAGACIFHSFLWMGFLKGKCKWIISHSIMVFLQLRLNHVGIFLLSLQYRFPIIYNAIMGRIVSSCSDMAKYMYGYRVSWIGPSLEMPSTSVLTKWREEHIPYLFFVSLNDLVSRNTHILHA